VEKEIKELLNARNSQELMARLNAGAVSAEFTDSKGVSLFMLSIYHGVNDLTRFLFSKLQNLTFFEASAYGKTNLVAQWLDRQPALMNTFSPDGFTALSLASYFGQLETANFLVKHGADVNLVSTNSFQVAPLHAATAGKHYAIVELLLANGADVNARQQNDWVPLHSAAQHGDVKLIQMLMNAGADTTPKTSDDKTALDLAIESKSAEAINLLLSLKPKSH
jgi:uncharacterized protein